MGPLLDALLSVQHRDDKKYLRGITSFDQYASKRPEVVDPQAITKDYVDWVLGRSPNVTLEEYAGKKHPNVNDPQIITKEYFDWARGYKSHYLIFDRIPHPLDALLSDKGVKSFKGFEIHATMMPRLVNSSIKVMWINSKNVRLELTSCRIAWLEIAKEIRAHVVARNTGIGTLVIEGESLSHFEMHGGFLLNVKCPPPGKDNPFSGTVLFSNVFLPLERDRAQPYRSLRHHLSSLQNTRMASLMHAAELIVERKDDPWTNKIISWTYQSCSNFGASTLRPIIWLTGFFVFSFLAIYTSNGTSLASDPSSYVGWQSIFLESGRCAQAFKAAYLSFQPIANPFGIFEKTPLLIPSSAVLAIWLSIQGVASVILIALFFFAARRRFKIS